MYTDTIIKSTFSELVGGTCSHRAPYKTYTFLHNTTKYFIEISINTANCISHVLSLKPASGKYQTRKTPSSNIWACTLYCLSIWHSYKDCSTFGVNYWQVKMWKAVWRWQPLAFLGTGGLQRETILGTELRKDGWACNCTWEAHTYPIVYTCVAYGLLQ